MFNLWQKIGFFMIPIFFVSDRFLKSLSMLSRPKDIIGDWVAFNYVSNHHIAFSIPLGGIWLNWFILVVTLGISYYFFFLWQKKQVNESLCLFMMILGSASNLYDRIRFGAVVDYIDVRFFTVFNLADVLIVIGVVGLIILTMRGETSDRPAHLS